MIDQNILVVHPGETKLFRYLGTLIPNQVLIQNLSDAQDADYVLYSGKEGWSFYDTLEPGHTASIWVNWPAGLASFANRSPDASIRVSGEGILPAHPEPEESPADTVEPGATLSFLGLTNLALRLVRRQYPAAQLYEAQGVSSKGPTRRVQDVDQLQFIFKAGAVGTAFISTTVWGEFGRVTYSPEPWTESLVIPWPFDLGLEEAAQLKSRAGYDEPYGGLTLRWPLGFRVEEPYYIFGTGKEPLVEVGVYDRVVRRLQLEPDAADAAITKSEEKRYGGGKR